MRLIAFTTGCVILASCTAGSYPAATRTVEKQREYEALLLGKVPQQPVSCLPHYQSNDMRTIDDHTILFRNGGSRTYVANMHGDCSGLASGHYTLVTRQYGSADLCSGDIARVVDLSSGMMVGSCAFGDFVPYVKPRG